MPIEPTPNFLTITDFEKGVEAGLEYLRGLNKGEIVIRIGNDNFPIMDLDSAKLLHDHILAAGRNKYTTYNFAKVVQEVILKAQKELGYTFSEEKDGDEKIIRLRRGGL